MKTAEPVQNSFSDILVFDMNFEEVEQRSEEGRKKINTLKTID